MAVESDRQDQILYDELFAQHVELESDTSISAGEKAVLQRSIREQVERVLERIQSAQAYRLPNASTAEAPLRCLPMKREHSERPEEMSRNVKMRPSSTDGRDNDMASCEDVHDGFDWNTLPYLSLPEKIRTQEEMDQQQGDAELAWELQLLEDVGELEKRDAEFARNLRDEEEAAFGTRNATETGLSNPQPPEQQYVSLEPEIRIKDEHQEFAGPVNWAVQYPQGEASPIDEDINYLPFPSGLCTVPDTEAEGDMYHLDPSYLQNVKEEGIADEWPDFDWSDPFPNAELSPIDFFNLSDLPPPHLDHSKPPDEQLIPFSLPDVVPLSECTEIPFQDIARALIPKVGAANLDPAGNAAAYNRYYTSGRTEDDLKLLLDNIQNSEFSDLREGTPEALVFPLMEHQKIGLAWMRAMEEGSNKGGILADDMGLGKTMQALALIASKRSTDENCKTTLIVAPVSLLKQWEREISRKIKPEFAMSVHIQHYASQKRYRSFGDLARFDIVLTTFGTIASEYKRRVTWNKLRENNPERYAEEPSELVITGRNSLWYRIIIDEAQCIKNKDTQSSRGCSELQAQFRFCLSGTPMQNSCDELYPLIRFLHIKPYNDWTTYSRDFSQPLKAKRLGDSHNKSLMKFRALLKAVLLRRLKTSMIDGKPILSLPPRTVEIVHPVFSPDEQSFYSALASRVAIQFNKYLRANAVGRNYSSILLLLLRLRQACCHPHLIKDIEDPAASGVNNGSPLSADLISQLPEQTVSRIQETGLEECPVCIDMSDNPSIVIPCGHMFCRDCVVQVVNQAKQLNLSRGGEDEDDRAIARCPKCRGPLDMEKLIEWRTFEEALGDAKQNQVDWQEIMGKAKTSEEDKGKGKARPDAKAMARLRQNAFTSLEALEAYICELEADWMSSAKIDKCMEILENIISNNKSEKTIIFSQWTSLLQLLEVPIHRKGWKYRRYDGSMSSTARNDAVMQFTDDPSIKIMLISLKAGNSGLNLVAASQVILMDPFYNPYVEEQAIDRAHRIGQVRPIKVHRLVVEGTVEDKIVTIQNEKKALIEGALDEKEATGIGRLHVRDLAFLFGINLN